MNVNVSIFAPIPNFFLDYPLIREKKGWFRPSRAKKLSSNWSVRLLESFFMRVWLENDRGKNFCPLIRGIRFLECPLIREFTVFILP